MGVRSTIFARGIYALFALEISIRKSKHCSAFCVRGVFEGRVRPHRVSSSYPVRSGLDPLAFRRQPLARKTVLVCDNCGKEVGEGKGATLRLTYSDARRGAKQADLCDDCSGKMPGRAVARRGRRPKAAAQK